MDCEKLVQTLKSDHFRKITNTGKWFEEGSAIYAKEIRENIFLLFVTIQNANTENMRAMIADFDSFDSIGIKEPKQILFYLAVKSTQDLHYFEKYLKTAKYELAAF